MQGFGVCIEITSYPILQSADVGVLAIKLGEVWYGFIIHFPIRFYADIIITHLHALPSYLSRPHERIQNDGLLFSPPPPLLLMEVSRMVLIMRLGFCVGCMRSSDGAVIGHIHTSVVIVGGLKGRRRSSYWRRRSSYWRVQYPVACILEYISFVGKTYCELAK